MKRIMLFLLYLLGLINGLFFTIYFRINCGFYLSLIISFLLIFLIKKAWKIKMDNRSKILLLMFSLIFTFFIILGYKLNIEASFRQGNYLVNYIKDFLLIDLYGAIFICTDIYFILKYIIYKLKILNKIKLKESLFNNKIKKIFLLMLVLFVLWLPYFLIYYPGIVIADSNATLYQALSGNLNNHFSYFYSLYVKFVIDMCNNNLTNAIAVTTIIQMIYSAFGISYLINWLNNKGANKKICTFITLLFGIVPFFAVQTIIMWRDTIFSISVMLWTLLLIDYCIYNKEIFNIKFILKNILLIILIILSRNNGFFVILVTFLILIILKIFKAIKFNVKVLTLLCFLGIFLYLGILSPIYKHYNLKEDYSDSLGVPLQQMASVVVNKGNIDEKELEVLNKITPIYLYYGVYRPCIVDTLKWNPSFNDNYIKENKDLFFKTYLSLLVKNPVQYIKSWGLITYGYWAFNNWELNNVNNNILFGDIDQLSRSNLDVKEENLLKNKFIDLKKIFIIDDTFISLSIVNWFIFFICLVLIIKKNYKFLISLAPSLGVIFSLLIASPNAYWQRYGLVEYYLLPVYVLILIYAFKEE